MKEVAPPTRPWRPGLVEGAVYERLLAVGPERIWENVLDWEHLPWLHRSSFVSIELEAVAPGGWRARIGIASAAGPRSLRTEVVLDRPALRYVTRTLEGPGEGTEIWTALAPEGPRATRIRVSFRLPVRDVGAAQAIGARLVETYTRLWDEDEAMMVRRQEVLDARAGSPGDSADWAPVALGTVAALRTQLPCVVQAFGAGVRVAEHGGALVAHGVRCPHWGGPLEDTPIEDGCVVCPWHGYRFDVCSGNSADARRLALVPGVRVRVDEGSGLVWLERAASRV